MSSIWGVAVRDKFQHLIVDAQKHEEATAFLGRDLSRFVPSTLCQ